MKGRWWMGVTAGMVIGLGTVAGVQAATSDGSSGNPVVVSPQQLKINQRISQAAVKRSNQALKNDATLGSQVPLFAVSSGAVGSNLVRGRGAVSAQRIDDGNYRVKFDSEHQRVLLVGDRRQRRAAGGRHGDGPPRARHDRRDAHPAGGADEQRGRRTPVNAGFHVQVFC